MGMTPAELAPPSSVGVPVRDGAHAPRLQALVQLMALEAGLAPQTASSLAADSGRLVSELLRVAPGGALFMLNPLRRGGRVGLEVTAEYGPSPYAPAGGRVTATAWEGVG